MSCTIRFAQMSQVYQKYIVTNSFLMLNEMWLLFLIFIIFYFFQDRIRILDLFSSNISFI